MIKFSKEKVLLLHQLIAEETGGDVVEIGLGVASGEISYEQLLEWVKEHIV